jgi:hypothetical protein
VYVLSNFNRELGQEKLIYLQQLLETKSKFHLMVCMFLLNLLDVIVSLQELAQPHRKVVKEGILKKKSLRDGESEDREVYLCSDILVTVLTLSTNLSKKLDKVIPLISSTIIDNAIMSEAGLYIHSPLEMCLLWLK